jgi:5-(carboxyamino)imidazole ribonucleotide synthase
MVDFKNRVIGILGGGQLAQMTINAAHNLGFKVHVFSDSEDAIAFHNADFKTCAEYGDIKAIDVFATSVDIVTYEFENIPSETVKYLEANYQLSPNANCLAVCQKRNLEKTFVNNLGIKTANFAMVETCDEAEAFFNKNGPAILKTNSLGYDGKGQYIIKNKYDLAAINDLDFDETDYIIEQKVDFSYEISVLIARNASGEVSTLPITRNIHKNGILNRTFYPAGISDIVQSNAAKIAQKIANTFDYVGILAIEMFVMLNGDILVNEMAPRPHNTGHWTIDACDFSQFDLFVKAITNQSLPVVNAKFNAEMVNLIGSDINQIDELSKDESVFVHNYGKNVVKEGRKMGHYTIIQSA